MTGLRIISGTARGRRIKSVPGDTTRPITDRTKESLFNILGRDIEGAAFLDLFGGTGSVGIESLSRGASFARFLDLERLAVQTIKTNLLATELSDRAEVQRVDAFQSLGRQPDRNFDYIYIAPPQYKELWKRALIAIDNNPGWLSPDGWVIVQIHPREAAPVELTNLLEFDRRTYGSTLLIFYSVPEVDKG
jgi:16S rRNA (guanine966-N2)-methyltransferase